MEYLPRVVDQRLDRALNELPALSIEGAKGVGKTATAIRRTTSMISLDDPEEVTLLEADRRRVDTTGRAAYRRPDGIAVIPAALLGP